MQCGNEDAIDHGGYELVIVEPASEDWQAFHDIQRVTLFEQDPSEYDAHYHDHLFHRPASRTQLLLKFNGQAIGVTTLDVFPDRTAATRSVAITHEKQHMGHGAALGKLTQEFARGLGCSALCVNAGAHVTDFYRSLGFTPEIWDIKEYDGIGSPETMIQMVYRLS